MSVEQSQLADDMLTFTIQAGRRSIGVFHRAEQLEALTTILADVFIKRHFSPSFFFDIGNLINFTSHFRICPLYYVVRRKSLE